MAAVETLTTAYLGAPVTGSDMAVRLVDTDGAAVEAVAGTRVFVDRELMAVMRVGVDAWVDVRRGVDGTGASPHAKNAIVLIGRADQFYDHDPVGAPLDQVLVMPWVNVITGDVWQPLGDALGPGNRYWQKYVGTHSTGPLGVHVLTIE